MKCPQCGKEMRKVYTGEEVKFVPPEYPWNWVCKCGESMFGGMDQDGAEFKSRVSGPAGAHRYYMQNRSGLEAREGRR